MEDKKYNGNSKKDPEAGDFHHSPLPMNGGRVNEDENDENWENTWPVEVNIETIESDSKEDNDKRTDDSESDFLGFEDIPAKQPLANSSLLMKSNRCPHCEYKTRRKDHFKRHVMRHPEQTLYPLDDDYRREKKQCTCTVCGYTTMRSDHFKRHMMRHTGEKPYSCLSCDYSTTHSIHLKRHVQRHSHTPNSQTLTNTIKKEETQNGNDGLTGGMPYTNGSIAIFESKPRDKQVKSEPLVEQIKTEAEDKQIEAETYVNGDGGDEWVSGLWPVEVKLEEAETSAAERPPKKRSRLKGPHVCSECGYATLRGDHFKRHLMRHTGEKPYSCSYCEYRSTHAIHLKRHMSLHTNDRPYSCHFCPFRAIRPHHLRDHIRIHTGERPYVCHLCGFSAAQSGNYKSHMRTHMEDKPFVCEICGYSTVKNSNLVNHMRMHTGDKSFSCDLCDYKAMKSADVSRHKSRIHGIGVMNVFKLPLPT